MANDAVGSLDVAAELGVRAVNALPDADHLVSTLFPDLTPRRYRTTGARLRVSLEGAGAALAAMAVPWAFTTYERYAKQVLMQLRALGRCALSEAEVSLLGLEDLHAQLSVVGVSVPAQDERLFDFARKVRNRLIHAGGTAGNLLGDYHDLSRRDRGASEWNAGRQFTSAVVNGLLALVPGEALAVIATTRRLAQATNISLQRVLNDADWLKIALDEYVAARPTHSNDRRRFLGQFEGYIRKVYPSVTSSREDIRRFIEPYIAGRLARRDARRGARPSRRR